MVSRLNTTSRFSSVPWFDEAQKLNVLIAGLGGIGSNVAYNIGRIHPNSMILYDNDKVEIDNISGQFYGLDDVNSNKVTAIANMLHNRCSYYNICANNERLISPVKVEADVMISGFDNMSSREYIFKMWLDSNSKLLIDGRMSAEYFQVFALCKEDTSNIHTYQSNYLFEDFRAENGVCSYKQTTFMATMIGSVITNVFVNYCTNLAYDKMRSEGYSEEDIYFLPRDIPFLTTYDASTMMFQTKY